MSWKAFPLEENGQGPAEREGVVQSSASGAGGSNLSVMWSFPFSLGVTEAAFPPVGP